jgi:hypothetical protein
LEAITSDDRAPSYFSWQQTESFFPTLHLDEDYIPLGNPKEYCLHLDWVRKDYRKMHEKYYRVQEFPTCSLSTNPRGKWYKSDPTDGIDFKVWH